MLIEQLRALHQALRGDLAARDAADERILGQRICVTRSGRGAQGVGRATKGAVVAASVLILAANFILTELFFAA